VQRLYMAVGCDAGKPAIVAELPCQMGNYNRDLILKHTLYKSLFKKLLKITLYFNKTLYKE
jgi:hypothetical protein